MEDVLTLGDLRRHCKEGDTFGEIESRAQEDEQRAKEELGEAVDYEEGEEAEAAHHPRLTIRLKSEFGHAGVHIEQELLSRNMTLGDIETTLKSTGLTAKGYIWRLTKAEGGEDCWVRREKCELVTAKEETADLIFNGEWRREPGALGKEWRWHLFQQPLPEQWLTYQIQVPGINAGEWVVLKIRIHPARKVADITQALLNEISNQGRQMPGTMMLGKKNAFGLWPWWS
jgi:hypothetical protein